jgi:hypothetical protein
MRWRLALVAAAVMTLLAGASGYLLGDRAADDGAEVVAARGGDDASVAEEGTVPDQSSVGGTGGPAIPPYLDAPVVTAVVARQADDGTQIRVVQSTWPVTTGDHADPGWMPPAACVSIGSLEIGLVSDAYVAMGWGELFQSSEQVAVVSGSGWTGYPRLGAFLYAAVQATGEVREVHLDYQGRTLDRVTPTDGWAVVAAQLPAVTTPLTEEFNPVGQIVIIGEGGAELSRRTTGQTDTPYERPECQPPPPGLPEGVEPITDPEVRQAIETAFRGAFERVEGEVLEGRAFIQQGDRLDEEFLDDLSDRTADLGITDIHLVVKEIGVVDDRTALVLFELDGTPIGWQYGEAVLVEGSWLVSSQTWCSLVEQAGVTCPTGMRDPERGASRYGPAAWGPGGAAG